MDYLTLTLILILIITLILILILTLTLTLTLALTLTLRPGPKVGRVRGLPGGGTQIWVDRGVPLEPQNPYPSLKVILAVKGTYFKGFFLKNRPSFQKFRGFRHVKTQKFGLSQKS